MQWAGGNTETRNWSKEREKGVWIVQPQMGHLFETPSSSSRTIAEEAERLQELEAREEQCETVTSVHDRVTALMNQ